MDRGTDAGFCPQMRRTLSRRRHRRKDPAPDGIPRPSSKRGRRCHSQQTGRLIDNTFDLMPMVFVADVPALTANSRWAIPSIIITITTISTRSSSQSTTTPLFGRTMRTTTRTRVRKSANFDVLPHPSIMNICIFFYCTVEWS
jgi:hypothetical protein